MPFQPGRWDLSRVPSTGQEGYSYRWSVSLWLVGERPEVGAIGDLTEFATTLAGFLRAVQHADAAGAPAGAPGRRGMIGMASRAMK
jgi:hypothetical protein